MLKNLIISKQYQSWKVVVLLFTFIAVVHFTAAFFKSVPLNLLGLILYALIPLVLIKKESWGSIGIRKISFVRYVLWGCIWAVVFVVISSLLLYFTVGLSTANFLVVMAKQQLSYGVISQYNAWRYFPIAVVGFCTISPLTEEIFFRGLLLKALEKQFSDEVSNLIQGLLFGFIHLAYLWLTEFDARLIVTMIPAIALAGYLYGWVAQRTGSVFASMIVHSMLNCVLLVLIYGFIIPALR